MEILSNTTTGKKVLIIFTGQAFRYFKAEPGIEFKLRKTVDEDCSIEQQLNASLSHTYLIKYIKKIHNIQCDYCIITYKTIHENRLLTYYPDSILNIFYEKTKGYAGLLTSGNTQLEKEFDIFKKYDIILYVRIDLLLSEFFIKSIKLNDDYIYFTHLLGPPGNPEKCEIKTELKDMYVCDMFIQVPKKHFNVIQHNFLNHTSTKTFITKNNTPQESIKFLIQTIHRASTHMGWNPLYIVTNRPLPQPLFRALNPSVAYFEDICQLEYTPIFNDSKEGLIKYYEEYKPVIFKTSMLDVEYSEEFLKTIT